MAGFTRQSTYSDGDIIQSADSNDEFDQLVASFNALTGHKHDGTAAEGPIIGFLGDPGVGTALNKIEIDSTNSRIKLSIDESTVSVEKFYFESSGLVPAINNNIDLGSSEFKFKDGYFAGDLTVDGNIVLGGDILLGDEDTDTVTFAAGVDSSFIPTFDDSYDLGSDAKQWRDLYVNGLANVDNLIANNVSITGGSINGTVIGATTPAAVTTTNLVATTADINAGTIDNTVIGATTPVAGSFTNATASGTLGVIGNTTVGGTLGVTGATTLSSTLGVVGNQTNTGNLTVNGNTTLGNAATDTVTVTADVASNLIPSLDNTYDLGASGSEWRNLWVTGTANIDTLTIGTSTGITSIDTDLTAVSASNDTLASAKAIKTYIDTQVTAQDLDFQADTGGTLNIDLDSETLTIAGGTGVETVGSGNTVTVSIDSTVATLTGSQNLTNKTITAPTISSVNVTGGTINNTTLGSTTPATVRGTTITATTGFVGNVTGTVSSIANHTTTNLTEGSNLYYTAARFNTAFAGKSTSDLTETTNLYYTAARANTAIDARVTQTYVNDLNVDAATLNGKTSTDIEATALALSIALG